MKIKALPVLLLVIVLSVSAYAADNPGYIIAERNALRAPEEMGMFEYSFKEQMTQYSDFLISITERLTDIYIECINYSGSFIADVELWPMGGDEAIFKTSIWLSEDSDEILIVPATAVFYTDKLYYVRISVREGEGGGGIAYVYGERWANSE